MLTVVLGYLIGSFPSGYVASRLLEKTDIRKLGDRNVGAANVFNQMGLGAGLVVLLLDIAKGAGSVILAQAVSSSQAIVLATGAAAVVGHNWLVDIGCRYPRA